MMSSAPPIFIIGVHRSGTTLLRFMLSSHPAIYIPPESDFIPRFFRRKPEEILSPARAQRILDLIFTRYRFGREWQGPALRGVALPGADLTPAVLLDALYSAYAAQNGAARWGDKTPIYSSYVDLLARIFPAAQFIHLTRDGRDVALSMLDKWGAQDFHIDMYFAARNWDRRTRQARRAGARLGESRYLELRYEDLVADPDVHLQSICRFLGEPYDPAMARQHELARGRVEAGSFHDAVRQPPSTGRVARWQREMTPADLRLFQRLAGALLQELGYPLAEAGTMNAAERLRMAALAAKYCLLQAGRRAAAALGLLPPI